MSKIEILSVCPVHWDLFFNRSSLRTFEHTMIYDPEVPSFLLQHSQNAHTLCIPTFLHKPRWFDPSCDSYQSLVSSVAGFHDGPVIYTRVASWRLRPCPPALDLDDENSSRCSLLKRLNLPDPLIFRD